MKNCALLVLISCLLFVSCKKDDASTAPETPPKQDVLPQEPVEQQTENIKYSFQLSDQSMQINAQARTWGNDVALRLCQLGDNFVFSPLSVQAELMMLANGASEQGASEIIQLLGLQGYSIDNVNAYFKEIANGLSSGKVPSIELILANSIWLDKSLSFQQSFSHSLTEYYQATVACADFAHAPAQAKQEIDNWAAAKTKGKISSLSLSVSDVTRMVLANSTYFAGKWASPFLVKNTHEGAFFNADGQAITAHMMQDESVRGYSKNGLYEMVSLPFQASPFTMLIALPRAEVSLEDALHAINWAEKLQVANVDLTLPKFEVKASSEMSAILKALGVNDVFKQLPGVATGPTKVDLCTQDACISVEEEGCSAAAVTAVSSLISPGGNSDYPTVTLNVNRPFLFAIQEQSTGIILFQGAVLSF